MEAMEGCVWLILTSIWPDLLDLVFRMSWMPWKAGFSKFGLDILIVYLEFHGSYGRLCLLDLFYSSQIFW